MLTVIHTKEVSIVENGNKESKNILKTLEEIKKLLQQSIAIQLYCSGATQDQISKNLKITKSTINKMVKGVKRKKAK